MLYFLPCTNSLKEIFLKVTLELDLFTQFQYRPSLFTLVHPTNEIPQYT